MCGTDLREPILYKQSDESGVNHMSMIERVIAKAKSDVKTIVFPEGNEERTIRAAERLMKEGIAKPILLGEPDAILCCADRLDVDLTGITIENSLNDGKFSEYVNALHDIRKNKGVTREDAEKLCLDPMYYGIMMVKMGDADGLVSGAVHTTGDMLRPALQIIKTKPEMKIVSSSFLMDCPDKSLGEDGLLVYADCVVMPSPTAQELAYIAIAAADTARRLCGFEQPQAVYKWLHGQSLHRGGVEMVAVDVGQQNKLEPLDVVLQRFVRHANVHDYGFVYNRGVPVRACRDDVKGHSSSPVPFRIPARSAGFPRRARSAGRRVRVPCNRRSRCRPAQRRSASRWT